MARSLRIAVSALRLSAVGVVSFAFSPNVKPTPAANTRALCGVERWTVKTLQDRPSLLPQSDATIESLVTRRPPSGLSGSRLPFERHVFRVTAAVTLVLSEDDGDLHLVLSDGGQTMIAESPSASCGSGATLQHRRQMAQARTQVGVCARARVTGVAFFDFNHGQTGVAPNAIELHPIVAFQCLSSAPAATSGHGRVRLVSITSRVSAGSHASLTVAVSSASTCSITVNYLSGPSSAQGLYRKRSTGGRVSWTWTVGTKTTAGRWPIIVSCGSVGTLNTSFVVT
jgi:hypothetical protein